MKQEMISFLYNIENDIYSLCKYLYDNPEESYKEEKASKYISNLLKEHNFEVTENYLNIPNSFKAVKGVGHPKICYLCEYDAVKDLGHITGHNALTAISVSAALCLGKIINKIGGSVTLIGCPGEYLGGTKNIITMQGEFDDMDVVMECHPDIETCESGTSKAISALKISYSGKSGLAFLNKRSYTSLDSLLLTINIIDSISKGFPEDTELNYIISEAGYSPSLIPGETSAKFYIRSSKFEVTSFIENQLRNISNYITSLTGIENYTSIYEPPSYELTTNKILNRLFNHNLKENGIIHINPPKNVNSGLSLGIVSKRVPCIHPYISIVENSNIKYGSIDFANATLTTFAQEQIKKAALALAFTGADVIVQKHLLSELTCEYFSTK